MDTLGKMKEAKKMMENKIKQEEQKVTLLTKETKLALDRKENYLIAEEDGKYSFSIKDKTLLYLFNKGHNLDLTFSLSEKANFTLSFACISDHDCKVNLRVYHETSHTKSEVSCHGLSTNQTLTFAIEGYVPKYKKGCICNQKSMIHNLKKGKGEIDPDPYIEEFDVTANHSAFVGPLEEEKIFYLNTKGIPTKMATQLLLKSFLLGTSQNQIYNQEIERDLEKTIY